LDFDDAQLGDVDPSTLPSSIHPCHAPSLVRVDYVVDGDTLDVTDVLGGDTSGRVRVIGVDTPEVAHGATPADCYGDEAAAFTLQLKGHVVWLTFDAECRDVYDRLLAYVLIGIGKNDSLERQLLRRGFARAYPYGDNRTFEQLFDSDEQAARDVDGGLWGACP
jgi:micrococcal nuclease